MIRADVPARRTGRNTTLIMLAVVVLTAALLVAGLVLESAEVRLSTDTARITTFLLDTRKAVNLVTNMENGLRGYVLTGQDSALAPYEIANEQLPRLQAELSQEAAVIDARSTETVTLTSLVSEMNDAAGAWNTKFARPEIQEFRSGRVIDALYQMTHGEGKSLFDSFRTAGDRLENQSQRMLNSYNSELSQVSQLRQGFLLVLSVLALGSAIFGVLALRRDARLQEEAREAANAETERLRTVIENLPVAVRLLNAPGGEVILHNRLSEELSPAVQWDAVPQDERASYFGVVKPDGSPLSPNEDPIIRALQRGETVTNYEVLMRSPAGERSLLMSTAPLRDKWGRITEAVAVSQDVTEAKLLDQRKDEFIATAAHELRNPLTALLGHYQLLTKTLRPADLSDDAQRHLDGLGKQIRRLIALVDRLLDLSRIEMGRLDLDKSEFDIVKLAQAVMANARASDSGVHDFRLDAPAGPIPGTWDETRIEQAMTNLTSNASRYSPPGTHITLRVRRAEQGVRVEVVDEGPGVPAEQQPSLFSRYHQAGGRVPANGARGDAVRANAIGSGNGRNGAPEPGRHAGGKGLGLGLYITSEIVRAHGGHIGVAPNPAGGSVFWFTLPT